MMQEESRRPSRKHLAFALGEEQFAVDVDRVDVVLDVQPITRVPRAADFIHGVINHRGSVIPVVDLKLRFGMGRSEVAEGTSIIVMNLDRDGESVTVGLLADRVREVVDLDSSGVERAPAIGRPRIDEAVVEGVARDSSGAFVVVVDVDAAFRDGAGKNP